MKKTSKMRSIIILLVALSLAMLLGAISSNCNAPQNTASAASESANDSLTLTLKNDGSGYKVAARNKQIVSVCINVQKNT